MEMLSQKSLSRLLGISVIAPLVVTLVAAGLGEDRAPDILRFAAFPPVVDFVPAIAKFSAVSAFPSFTKVSMAINWIFAALTLMSLIIFRPVWHRDGFQRLSQHLQTPQASPVRFVLGACLFSLMALSDVFDLPFLSLFRGNWLINGANQPIQRLMDQSIFLTGLAHWLICAVEVIIWYMSLFSVFFIWRRIAGKSSSFPKERPE